MRRLAWSLALGVVLPAPSAAQQLNVRLREEGSLTPIPGALVRLIGDRGVLIQALTNESGRAVLRTTEAGRYRIRIDQIGAAGIVTDPFELALNETRDADLVIRSSRLTLPTLEVRGESRCGRRTEEGTLGAILWEEISKALTASVITEADTAALVAQRFRRELKHDGTITKQWTEYAGLHRGRFYATFAPEVLIKNGFVLLARADSVIYAAPDAELLLSEQFVATHCFAAAQGEDGLVGLRFEPEGPRGVADVRGVLWVQRETSQLKFLEYTYTGLPKELANLGLGGRVEYRRLPTGAWIVSEWHLRTPRLQGIEYERTTRAPVRFPGRGDVRVAAPPTRIVGLIELGGRFGLPAGLAATFDQAIVVGRIVDSSTGGGVQDAAVRLEGGKDSTFSDPDGRFMLILTAHGEQELVARHPKLALPGVVARVPVILSLGDTSRATFTVPSARTLARPACGARKDRAGVVGMVLGASGAPASGVDVVAEWKTPSGGTRQRKDRTAKDGLYALCDIPPDERVTVGYLSNGKPVAGESLELEWGAYRWLDLRLPE